jgi:predicted 2-oxoglutarate/Fe(II)-dependent dioxygenase YbiX
LSGEISEPYKQWLRTNMDIGSDRIELLRKAAAQEFDLWRIVEFLELTDDDIPIDLRSQEPDEDRIFVQIASYRDPECRETIDSLYEQARWPERVYVAVCWQHLEGDLEPFYRNREYSDRVRLTAVNVNDSQGVCWARRMTQYLWKGEEYTLVVDSHMRFIKNWDEKYIVELERCDSEKPLLSSTPASYEPPNKLEENPKVTVRRPDFFNEQGEMRCKGLSFSTVPEHPLRGGFIAAGFMFSRGSVIQEVPYDPYCYFNQEEVLYSIRLWTHGWDVYHPSFVTSYHYYYSGKNDKKPLHWKDSSDWEAYQQRGLERFNYITEHSSQADMDSLSELRTYGLGQDRSLDQFQLFTGIDFRRKKISLDALKCAFIPALGKSRINEIHVPELDGGTKDPKALAQIIDPSSVFARRPVVGSFFPWLTLRDLEGKKRSLQLYAGTNCVITVLSRGQLADVAKASKGAREGKAGGQHHFIWILVEPVTPSADLPDETLEMIQSEGLSRETVWDLDGVGEDHLLRHVCRDALELGPRIFILDRNLRVAAIDGVDPDGEGAARKIDKTYRGLLKASSRAPVHSRVSSNAHAPVLIVENVLDPGICRDLIAFWKQGRPFTGKVGSGDQSVVNAQAKRRADVHPSMEICREIDTRLAATLLPEIRKVFGVEIANRELYKIGRYDASDGGFFRQHRDNSEPELAHRRLALTLNLNDDYEGGELNFPEYGTYGYKPRQGACVVFPCALMHQVFPVRSGTRFMLVTFMFERSDEVRRRLLCDRQGKSHNANLFAWNHPVDSEGNGLEQ